MSVKSYLHEIGLLVIGLVAASSFATGCSNGDDPAKSQIEADVKCDDVAYNNETFIATIEIENGKDEILSTELFLDGKSLGSKFSKPHLYEINTSDMTTGEHELVGMLETADGKRKTEGKKFTLKVVIGTDYQGGLVVKVSNDGLHGTIAGKHDLNGGVLGLYSYGAINGMYEAYSMDDGLLNTEKFNGKFDNDYAAIACLQLDLNGYDDWYLPAYNEYALFEAYRELLNIPLRGGEVYWSSTGYKDNPAKAYAYSFGGSFGNPVDVTRKFHIRPCRRF